MPPKLFLIAHLDFNHLQTLLLFKVSQNFLKERLCKLRQKIFPVSGNVPERLEQGLVELLHAGGLGQQLHLGQAEGAGGGGGAQEVLSGHVSTWRRALRCQRGAKIHEINRYYVDTCR